MPFISGLAFIEEQPFGERCKVPVVISQPDEHAIAVNIERFVPALKISAPAGTQWITWILSVSACHVESGRPLSSGTRTLEVQYNDVPVPEQVLEFEIAAPAGSLVVTAARFIYKKWENNSWVAIIKEAFMPAGVIDARYRYYSFFTSLLILYVIATSLNDFIF